MPAKHLVLVHGQWTHPRRPEEERYMRTALVHGLNRVSPIAAGLVDSGEVKASYVYYGDVCNEVLCEAEPRLRERLVLNPVDGIFYEPDAGADTPLAKLFDRPTTAHTKQQYLQLPRARGPRRFVDDLARALSPLVARRLSRRIICGLFPDLGAYITSRKVGSRVRQRLQGPLLNALTDANDVAIVAHGMGTVAAYDVLWKFSHMSEYEVIHNRRVTLWLTLGSPLAEPAVRASLYDAAEPEDGKYPRNVVRWVNVSAHDDYVARGAAAEDDFREMRAHGCRIVDLAPIYNFWVSESGSDPHALYGYLDHPLVAEQLAAWVLASS